MDRDVYQEWFELETYHWWFVGRRALFVQMIEDILRQAPQSQQDNFLVADMGCGTGVNLDALSQFGKVIGVDVSHTALSFCRERKPYVLCQAPMDCLPFQSDRIRLLTAFDVLEHGEDDDAMLREALRVCVPGGSAVFTVPAYHYMWGDHDVAAHHFRRYSIKEIRQKIEGNGFQIQRITYYNSFLFPVSILYRQTKNLFGYTLRKAGVQLQAKSDFRSTAPPILNPILLKIFSAELHVLKRTNLPFGLSLCCIAKKPTS